MNRATFKDVADMAIFCAELSKLGMVIEVVSECSLYYTVTFWSEA